MSALTSLNSRRRNAEITDLGHEPTVDVLVIGGGVTGVGVALDAASRGLSVVLAERHDLAYGTSRWSSKLVHGGLRYLASGRVKIAYESAVERGTLIERNAPHLIRPLPQVVPLLPSTGLWRAGLIRTGYFAGDLLRMAARTPSHTLPRSHKVTSVQMRSYAPTIRTAGLRGGLVFWDGQLVDDSRLVVAIARTAAGYGAKILTRCAATDVTDHGATLHDTVTDTDIPIRARSVINASGVWASQVAKDVTVRPSRGTHLVFPREAFNGLAAGLTVPVGGETSRFVFALPADGRVYVGLTDEDAPGPIPDVPRATEAEIDFLIDTINTALAKPLSRKDMLGTYSGLRPLVDTGSGQAADVSRKHAIIASANGPITVIGGKLTTYRRMAEDAVDAAVERHGLHARACVTKNLPLVGATDRDTLSMIPAPPRLVRRYGTEAVKVLNMAAHNPTLLEPVAVGVDTTMAEFLFAVQHEGALDEADILDRRTRLGLSPADREAAAPSARGALLSSDGIHH